MIVTCEVTVTWKVTSRAVEIYMRLRHPDLQSAQETLEEIEKKMSRE
ncbi:MAG: hypothetical protein PHQ36_00695 [Anaerolineales bacterium]|nr:hypothetical protein [Anaerolineales bacterium]